MSQFIAVPDILKDCAGSLVWWELSGLVNMDDMRESFDGCSWSHDAMPEAPTLETALARAAAHNLTSKRQLLRPLSERGTWEITLETIEKDEHTKRDRLAPNKCIVRGWVESDGGVKRAVVEGDEDMKTAILAKVSFYQRVLTPTDYSAWLLQQAGQLHAIGLRRKGGFYFIPSDKLPHWKQIVAITKACSDHQMEELPAMKTEDAIETIIRSVRMEAFKQVEKIEAWLKQETLSTRGLNSSQKQAEEMKAKLEHYCGLLGKNIPDLEQRLERLTGAIQAAKIVAQTDGKAATT
jgi:hypothetical protein